MKQYLLYGLYCPNTDDIKYIGITTSDLKKRLNSHLSNPTNYLTKKWFEGLKNESKKPLIKLIKECKSYEDLLLSEINEIKKNRDNNIELLNITEGGVFNPMKGKKHTNTTKKIISEKNSGKKIDESTKVKIKIALVKKWQENTLLRIKHSEINSGIKNPFYGKKHSKETIEKLKQQPKKYGIKNPNHKYNISEDVLYDMYITQKKTIEEISKLFGCSINTINKNLRKYNIKKPISNIYGLNKNEIVTYLSLGLNYVQIGEKYGCSNRIIHKYVKKHNLYVK